MDIHSTQQGPVLIVSIAGSMDALTAPDLMEEMRQQIEAGHANLVVDMTELEYTSSAGLRALLSGVKDARQHAGDLRLAGLRPNVRKVLEMSGFTTILKVFPSVAEAVQSYS
jgi:anti-anti-sigma factor